jgi:myosin heavy subunit
MLTFHVLFQEYIQDGIDWTKVDFEDNQDCLSLFEKVQNMMHQMYFLDFSIIGSIENN